MKTDAFAATAAEIRILRMVRALANPARFRIVVLLAERKDCAAAQLAEAVSLAQSTLSEHLTALREAGMVQTSGEGPYRYYCLDPAAVDFLAAYLAGLGQRVRSWEELVVATRADGRNHDPGGDGWRRGGDRDASTTRGSRIASPPWKRCRVPPRSAPSGWPPADRATRSWWRPMTTARCSVGARSTPSIPAPPTTTSPISRSTWRGSSAGRGIGDALLAALESARAGAGYHKMVLAAFPTNAPGMRLYERHGFTTVGIYHEQGMLDGRWVDVIVMEKILG